MPAINKSALTFFVPVFFALAAPAALHAQPQQADNQPAASASSVTAVADPALQQVLDHPRRDGDRARDIYRHPAQTLGFFQLSPEMTVVEYTPGAGWYTRILAPYLAEKGHYIALDPDISRAPEGLKNYYADAARKLPARIEQWTGIPASNVQAYNTNDLPDGLKGTVDRVLLIRALHNMWRNDMIHSEIAAMRALLKDDGLLGVVQHRARQGAPAADTDGNKGYMREGDIIGMMDAYGFELVSRSDINANPKDTADHDIGVWALPPALAKKEAGREAYKAIGESDRMTLLFRKRP